MIGTQARRIKSQLAVSDNCVSHSAGEYQASTKIADSTPKQIPIAVRSASDDSPPHKPVPPHCDRCGRQMELDFLGEMWICMNPMCGLVWP
jgi:hypothetical protein